MLNIFNRKKTTENNVIIGIAGTRGKTTLLHTMHQVLAQLGMKTAFLSSNGYSDNGKDFKIDHTANTADAGFIQKFINNAQKNKARFILIEVTTAGILRGVYNGVQFNSGLITNMFYDDPEFYKNIEYYADSKLPFINSIIDEGILVTFSHSEFLDKWLNEIGPKVKNQIYSIIVTPENFRSINHTLNSLEYFYEDTNIASPLISDFHVVNTAMIMKLLENYLDRDMVISTFQNIQGVEGRMEAVMKEPFTIVIDYAYRGEMIEDALKYLRSIKDPLAKIITVMGVNEYGIPNRLNTAEVAAKHSDLVIFAAEDPGSKRVYDLNEALMKAIPNEVGIALLERFDNSESYSNVNLFSLKSRISASQRKNVAPIVCFDADDYTSRLDAIDLAIKIANDGDIVYITGKGHEKTIYFGNTEYNWSEHEAVAHALSTKL